MKGFMSDTGNTQAKAYAVATTQARSVFPFAALAGQPLMRRALLANALFPAIGGVLLRGQKGTAKSTAVRGLAALLPPVPAVAGCPWRCPPHGPLCARCAAVAQRGPLPVRHDMPLVELPVSATEDRLTGALDMEAALRHGKQRFLPGLLAAAHRGLLYVDEVNLLPDHLADMLLDAHASGVNRVSRDGCTLEHPTRFALLGSMNPEEGPLRPQLLDRFGLCVDVLAPDDTPTRLEVLRRRDDFDADAEAFMARWQDAQHTMARRLRQAGTLLPHVRVPETRLRDMAVLTAEAQSAGHRGELALARAARALAALDQCAAVRDEHVQEAAALALCHRRRQSAPPPQGTAPDQHAQESPPTPETPPQETPLHTAHGEPQGHDADPPQSQDAAPEPPQSPPTPTTPPEERRFSAGTPYAVTPVPLQRDRRLRNGSGRHSVSRTLRAAGRCVGHSLRPARPDAPPDLALEATLRAAALRLAQGCGHRAPLPLRVMPQDWRHKKRERRLGTLIVFAVDASGSMGAAHRMREAKTAVLSLLLHAYQKRNQVALVAFRGQEGTVLLPPTASVERASRELDALPTGGRTPLASGLREARRIIDHALRRNPDTRPVLFVISDGRANVALSPPPDTPTHANPTPGAASNGAMAEALCEARCIGRDTRIHSLVVDVERGLLRFGLARQLAEAMGARHVPVQEVRAATLVGMVHELGEG